MARFPLKESEIMLLCAELAAGLTAHGDVYPAPPVDVAALGALLTGALNATGEVQEAKAVYAGKVEAKRAAFAALMQGMRDDLRYAEVTVHFDDELLKLLGWKARHKRRRLAAPGQAMDLRIVEEGPGRISLAWRAPGNGGKPAFYRVEQQRLGEDAWELAGVSPVPALRIEGQERGVEFWYRVVAQNKAGEGMPGNSVAAVL